MATSVEEKRIQIKIDTDQLTQYRPRTSQQSKNKIKKTKKIQPPTKSDLIYQYHALTMAQIVDINIDDDHQSMRKLTEKMQEGKVVIPQTLDHIYPSCLGFRRTFNHPKINLHTGLIDTTLTFRIMPLPDQEPLLDRTFIERAVVSRKLEVISLEKKLKIDTET